MTEAELASLGVAGELNANVNNMLKGEPIGHYLDIWDDVRQKTLALLKTKDDVRFASNIEEGLNYRYISVSCYGTLGQPYGTNWDYKEPVT
ncbi:hypothetical protein NYZ99_10025 [Maribacter litopenaei]|uniref:Uncharacterized protein n=1 Tax=Maribacter litopenaei TaxID=2976127 RepID=A0ABY5YBR7_9FLAO|nr:hypothetical protein [Maribacter litopenaei]UWX56486.1 hypothetical protein NYZ99_10025 [Maribacter litopenaei]